MKSGNRISGRPRIWIVALLPVLVAGCSASHPRNAATDTVSAPLPAPLVTSRALEPHPASTQPVGSFPFNMILSPDGKYAVTTSQGEKQMLCSVDVNTGTRVSSVSFSKTLNAHNGLYYGLTFAPDGTLFAAGGNSDSIAVLHLE